MRCYSLAAKSRSVRHGYTLVELSVTLPIMAMLVIGMGAAINIASKSIPDGTSISSATLTSSRAMDLMASELLFATSIATDVRTTGAARQLAFTIPDRDGVAPSNESVTYSWSGVAGDPLLRTFNGTTTTIATNVQEFALAYDKRANTVVTTSTNTSAESLLISSDGTTGASDASVTDTSWFGQYFLPVFASSVTGWSVTKVEFRARPDGNDDGEIAVQIQTSQNGLPTGIVLDEKKLKENDTDSSYGFETISFSNLPIQAPSQGMCLVLAFRKNTPCGKLKTWGGGQPFRDLVKTTNSGSTWTEDAAKSLCLNVYGTVTTDSQNAPIINYVLTNVRCTLRVGTSSASRLTTTIRVLNEPQVTGP
ncbi:MAG: hypothetical protein JWN70_5894 [Planctomycetaceae bacterium]|nr:hypothetical protein [Planctomycetaceae bacterium]